MGEETYLIIDGVRRAKACQLLGRKTIPAEIIDDEGHLLGMRDLPLDSLRSLTKDSIDVSTQLRWGRFMETMNLTKSGSPVPSILVTPGIGGISISDVNLDPIGG